VRRGRKGYEDAGTAGRMLPLTCKNFVVSKILPSLSIYSVRRVSTRLRRG
jgi:hypothetical protein